MLQLDSTTISAARMRIKFHCMSCLYVYGNKGILSYLMMSNVFIVMPFHVYCVVMGHGCWLLYLYVM